MVIAKKAPRRSTPATSSQDAIALLRADHKNVAELFAGYAKARSAAKKQDLLSRLCTELRVHTQVEEEIFYPAVQKALKDHKLIPEGIVEHASLKALIAQVEGVKPGDDLFEARVKVLEEYVTHHVKEEHTQMFPRAKATSLNLVALGEAMAKRKLVLLSEYSQAPEAVPTTPPRVAPSAAPSLTFGLVRGLNGQTEQRRS